MPSSSRPRYFLKRKKLLKKSASESNVAESLPPAPTTAFDHQAEPDSEQGDTQALPSTLVSTRDLVSAITTAETIETADSIDVNNGADDESSPKTESCYTDTISLAIRAANGGVEIENAFQAVSDGGRSAAGETMSSGVSKLLTSPIKIHARVRPLDEQDSGGAAANRPRSVAVNGKKELVLSSRPSAKTENAGNRHTFQFDYVMNETTTQREAYDITTQPLVERILQGFNACLIAYGTPATGKSHSLFGKASSGKHRGLITRATEVLLGSCNKENAEAKTKISMSFVQVYNEKIYDILDPSATDNIRFQEQSDPPALEGVTEWPVESVDDVTKQLRRNPNRVRESGRSHTIFTLRYRKETVADITVGNEDGETRRVLETLKGKLDFVDLVGVERTTKHSTKDSTGNTAVAKTNKSLQVFHNVVHCLLVKDATVSPYRDSKLTRMLHESMGGSCYTSLLVTVSPCPNFAHETLGCLNFVSKISSIENNPTSHVTVQEMKEEEAERMERNDKALLEARKIEEERSHHLRDIASQQEEVARQRQLLAEERKMVVEERILTGGFKPPSAGHKPGQYDVTPIKIEPGPKRQPLRMTTPSPDASALLWKHEAQQDRHFLEEEEFFLESLKHTPHHISMT